LGIAKGVYDSKLAFLFCGSRRCSTIAALAPFLALWARYLLSTAEIHRSLLNNGAVDHSGCALVRAIAGAM
jgi:hypothetical protein